MNTTALNILMNQGKTAFLAYCEQQRVIAEQTGYFGAAEYWENQAKMVF